MLIHYKSPEIANESEAIRLKSKQVDFKIVFDYKNSAQIGNELKAIYSASLI